MNFSKRLISLFSIAAAGLVAAPAFSQAQPVTIRIGHGSAAEDQLWLMKAKPEITPNQGKLYKLDFTLFRGGDREQGVFHPLQPPLLAIHRRLKETFDPKGVFNRGRMYAEF